MELFAQGVVREWEYRDHPIRQDLYVVVLGSNVDARVVKTALYQIFGVL